MAKQNQQKQSDPTAKLHLRDGGDNAGHAPESGEPTETGKHSLENLSAKRKPAAKDRDAGRRSSK